ncbi:MAG TPA: hypothetical protein ENK54_06555 [Thiotrichales bacterium]|nr:hypothetical protein [Thiotrichales bacterium]
MSGSDSLREHLYYGFFGLAMGMILAFTGLTEYGEMHSLFILQNIRLMLVFGATIGLSMLLFLLFTRGHPHARKAFTKGTIPGSILFGIGWALTGACPSVAPVQLGEGKIAAAATLIGILVGVWAYRRGTAGKFQFDTGVCGEE